MIEFRFLTDSISANIQIFILILIIYSIYPWSRASPRSFEVSTGGGGADLGESKPTTPKFRFLLGFRPLYFGNIGKSKKNGVNIQELFSKNRDFWGDIPRNFEPGEASPIPLVATPMAMGVVYDAVLILSFHDSEKNGGAPVP